VLNAILALGHKTHSGSGDSMHYFTYGYEKIELQRDIEYEMSV
jgi:hypothetical protein